MARNYPYVYPYSRIEARRRKETRQHERSFRLNASCARAIEQAINDYYTVDADKLREGCAQSVLERYGFKRVIFVLANTLYETGCPFLLSNETLQWALKTYVPNDGKYNKEFAVHLGGPVLEAFVNQTRQAYTALELFGPEHSTGPKMDLDYTGKVMVLSPDALRESRRNPHDQLWLATGGAGCDPSKLNQPVFAVCLGNGERACWNRCDFIGELDERFLPDWAAEKLTELSGSLEKQPETSSGGMEMK